MSSVWMAVSLRNKKRAKDSNYSKNEFKNKTRLDHEWNNYLLIKKMFSIDEVCISVCI